MNIIMLPKSNGMRLSIIAHRFYSLVLNLFVLIFLLNPMQIYGGETIVINNQMPATPVVVTATQSVRLTAGFKASGSASTFRAYISNFSSAVPVIDLASGTSSSVTDNGAANNYVKTYTAVVPGSTPAYLLSVQYFDGLGRELSNVAVGMSSNNSDLQGANFVYANGMKSKEYLPFQTSQGFGKICSNVPQMSANSNGDQSPYTEFIYEDNSLDRIKNVIGPGDSWHSNNKSKSILYGLSDNSILGFKVNTTGQLVKTSNFATGALSYSTSKDEDNNQTVEYKDALDRLVLRRQISESGNHDTYYVYDQIGRLCYVLPPMLTDELLSIGTSDVVVSTLKAASIDKYAYLYTYDDFSRCTAKKIPGVDWVYYVYDKAGRLILTQDGIQRTYKYSPVSFTPNAPKKLWTYFKYDELGREVLKGVLVDNSTVDQIRNKYKNIVVSESYTGSGICGYSNATEPIISRMSVFSVKYYDERKRIIDQSGALSSYLQFSPHIDFGSDYGNDKGLLVGTMVDEFHPNDRSISAGFEVYTAYYYDKKGNMVQTSSNNIVGGYDVDKVAYNFLNLPIRKKHIHTVGSNTVTEAYEYIYDNRYKLSQTKYSFNGEKPILLSSNVYDALGRVGEKRLHDNLYPINYSYNVRGWLQNITSSQFVENLHYNDNANNNSPTFNGNISSIDYGAGAGDVYNFGYDKLSRIVRADYLPSDKYSEQYAYDKNGNITTLMRHGLYFLTNSASYQVDDIDNLNITRDGNRIKKVSDNTEALYTSTLNGSTVSINDFKKSGGAGIDNEYLYDLNLPNNIQFMNGCSSTYRYDANGNKRSAAFKTSISQLNIPLGDSITTCPADQLDYYKTIDTKYVGNYIYENGDLKKVLTPEGYMSKVQINGTTIWQPNYFVKDHLGSNRLLLAYTDGAISTIQTTNYYPSGLEMENGYTQDYSDRGGASKNTYLYNGKEMDRMHGLNMYDYGARWYDPALATWTTVDPLAEKYYSISPYVYCSGNPVNRIDPDGRADFWLNRKVVGNDGVNDQKIYAIKTTEKDFNGVAGAGLSRKDQKATVDFIKSNSGNAEAFKNNGVAYTNSIGIESSSETRQAMVDVVTKDNGNGGTSAANNREYGGSIENGKVVAATPGAVANPKTDATANILLPSGVSTFHDHPSGTVVDAPPAGSYGGTTTTYSFTQSPSPMDINAAGTNTHYVFGRSDGNVYIYTSGGVQAVIPMKQFVTPKK
jgi:RHS repeat-associated protein